MNLKITVLALSCTLGACAFFDEPVDDLTPFLAGTPEEEVSDNPPPPPVPKTPVRDTESAKPATTNPTATTSGTSYFTAVTLFDIPKNAQNISFVHFSKRSKRREMAMCEALSKTYTVTNASEIPENAANLIVWPVASNDSVSSCNNMLADYEPIDISNKTAEKVNDKASGPFMLSRNYAADKRLIYDLSSVSPGDMEAAVTGWQDVLGNAADWPAYLSAK